MKEIDEYHNSGEFDPAVMSIKILKKLGPNQRALTLLHELLHASYWDAGMYGKKLDEETVVSALEGRVGALIRDNPQLVKYLQENLK